MRERFEDLHVGDELPALSRIVTREDVRAYADAGGDQNPLHQDDHVARMVGFDGIIAHGMFTMGHLGACVVGWAGSGEHRPAFGAVPCAGVHGGRDRRGGPGADPSTSEPAPPLPNCG